MAALIYDSIYTAVLLPGSLSGVLSSFGVLSSAAVFSSVTKTISLNQSKHVSVVAISINYIIRVKLAFVQLIS